MDRFLSEPTFEHLKAEKELLEQVPNVVEEEFAKETKVAQEDLDQLFFYDVPEDHGEGTCRYSSLPSFPSFGALTILFFVRSKIKAKDPFDLGKELFGSKDWQGEALGHPTAILIKKLDAVVKRISDEISLGWIGVYKRIENPQGFPFPAFPCFSPSLINCLTTAELTSISHFSQGPLSPQAGVRWVLL